MGSYYQVEVDGVTLAVRVQPRASAERVEGVAEGRLRVRLTAAPVDDAANKALVVLLARWLGVPRSRVKLVAGDKSREKRVRVGGDPVLLEARLAALGGGRDAEGLTVDP